MSVSPQEAARELLARRKARASLLAFIEKVAIEPAPALHHRLLIEKLQAVEDGEIDRLMVFQPPGTAKSTYGSILFPSHYMGRFGDRKVISGSYGSDLATSFGRKVRNLTETNEYRSVFSAGLSKDTKAKGEWELENGSSYVAVGVDSGVTGRRGDLAILDDIIKGRKEADSEAKRETAWQWYLGDLTSRLKPGAAIVYIATRWHEDDPAGRILPPDWNGESGRIQARDGEYWEVVCLPAQARDDDPLGRRVGEWLWPDYMDAAFWKALKSKQTKRNWSALYQQIPTPDEGTFFKREWFWRFELNELPKIRKYMTADFAVTEEEDGNDPDFTSMGVHGAAKTKDKQTKLYTCLDGWRDQTEPARWIDEYFNRVKRHKPVFEFAEVGVIRRALEGILRQKRRERRASGVIKWMPHIGDKMANARALQGMAEMGLVGIANTEFGDQVLESLIKFPAGKHDDDVDMLAMIARAVDETPGAFELLPEPEKERDRWADKFDDADEESWKIA